MVLYIILDSHLQRIGTLSDKNANGTPYYNDQITQQIADDDQELSLTSVPDNTNAYDPNGNTKNWGHTLDSLSVPYGYPDTDKIAEGNSLAYQDPNNGRWYIMRLTSVTDGLDQSGNHIKQATGVNLCIWKLGKTIHYAETLENCNSTRAFRELFDDTGWYMNPDTLPVGGSTTIQFDGTSSDQAMLQQLCQTYGVEIDAYILFPKEMKASNGNSYTSDFQVAMKRVDVRRHLGTDNGDRIVYGRNATNIQRTIVDDNLYTRLYVYGQNGSTCACSLTDNEPFVQDDQANAIYNPATGDNAENYLEGAITSQTMKNPERLAVWGLQQLKLFNHPRANYTVTTTSSLNNENGSGRDVMSANLGDTFRVIDELMNPKLTVEARVIRKQLSFSNPYNNNITLGEYTTVNVVPPSFITNLQRESTNHINDIINEIKHNPNALTCTIDKPDGVNWRYKEQQKKFIAHIYVMGDDITNLIQPRGFIWQLWQNGQINNDFTKEHQNDGQTLVLNNDIHLNSEATDDINSNNASNTSSNFDKTASFSENTNFSSSSDSNNTNDIDNNIGYFNSNSVSPDVQSEINSIEQNPNGTSDSSSSNVHYSFTDVSEPETTDVDDNNSDDDNSFEINGYNINEYLNAPETVVGNIRLLIDTDYIGNQQAANFNTSRIKHVFTVGEWKDHWGDGRVGALQYINYDPNNQYYYASLVYYGRNRPRKNGSLLDRTGHTEFVRLNPDGSYADSMILLFSHHNSNFGLDYTTPGGPYIWTTINDYYAKTDKYWLVRLTYKPNAVVNLNSSNVHKIMYYGEPSCMAYYDNSSDIVLFSHDYTITNPSHPVDFYHAQDLLNYGNNAKPFNSIRLTDYGFVPKMQNYDMTNDYGDGTSDPQDHSSQQTFQSSCLHYPYYFFDSGDINMSDQRMVYCIDIKSGSLVFATSVDLNDFDLSHPNNVIGRNPGTCDFAEPETFNWVKDDDGKLWFLYGLNVGYSNNRTKDTIYSDSDEPEPDYIHYEQLYKVGFDLGNNNSFNPNDHSENGHPQI